MNSSLRICCWTDSGTGGSDSSTDVSVPTPEVAAAGNGLFEAVDNASLLIPCRCSRETCDMVQVELLAEWQLGQAVLLKRLDNVERF